MHIAFYCCNCAPSWGVTQMINYNSKLFRRRRLRHLESPPPTLRELKNRKRLPPILNVILIYAENGISHQKLAEIVKINRKSLRKYTKWLTEKGLIRREGKRGNYFPTSKSKGGTYASAGTLCKQFLDMEFASILYRPGHTIPISIPEDLKEVASQYIRPRRITEEADYITMERILFDFSNIIGGFITYILIQSMNPSIKIEEHAQDQEEEDLVRGKWVGDVMSDLSEQLVNILVQQTWHYPTHFPSNPRKYTYFDDLTSSFSMAYPDLYEKLVDLMRRLPEAA